MNYNNEYNYINTKYKNDARWIQFKKDLLIIFEEAKKDCYNNLTDYLSNVDYDSFICFYGDCYSTEIEDFLRDIYEFAYFWDIIVELLYNKYLENNIIE